MESIKGQYARRLVACRRLLNACVVASRETVMPRAEGEAIVLELWRELQRALSNIGCKLHDKRNVHELIDLRKGFVSTRRELRGFCREACGQSFVVRKMQAQASCVKRTRPVHPPPKSLEELRARCPAFRATGTCRHLCTRLCYYREHEPARQLHRLHLRSLTHPLRPSLRGWTARLALCPRRAPFYWCIIVHDASGAQRGSPEQAWQSAVNEVLCSPLSAQSSGPDVSSAIVETLDHVGVEPGWI